jgi:hypothetical protein
MNRLCRALNWASFYAAVAYVVTVSAVTKPFEKKQ